MSSPTWKEKKKKQEVGKSYIKQNAVAVETAWNDFAGRHVLE